MLPEDPDALCVHGNPNVLTADIGTSSLAKGCTKAHVLVEVEGFDGPPPPVRAHQRTTIVVRRGDRPPAGDYGFV